MTDNMNSFSVKLKEVCLKLGLTQLEVANALGTTQSYHNRIENGKVPPPPTYLLKKLSELFKCDFTEFRDVADEERIEFKHREARKKTAALGLDVSDAKHAFRLVSVLNSISAGKLIDYTDMEYPTGWADDWEYCPEEIRDPHAFALGVDGDGDSMQPTISKGDRVLISPSIKVENGQISVVASDDGKTLKRVHFEDDHIYLTSDNPKYPPIFWKKEDDPKIIGRVVRVVKRV